MNSPANLRLVPGQIEGAAFIAARPVSMLADYMGFGKSAQAVKACDDTGALRILVICPALVRGVWETQFNQWSYYGRRVQILTKGTDKPIGDGVVVVSHKLASNPKLAARLKKRGGDFLILDEAHRLKDPIAIQTKAVLSATGICHAFTQTVFLTGTPMPNNAGELYPFCKTAGVWSGNRGAFVNAFCTTIETAYGTKIVGNANADKLKALLAPVYLRRTTISGLPSLRVDVRAVDGDLKAFERATDPATMLALQNAATHNDWQFFDTPYIATIRRQAGIAKASASAAVIIQELDDGEPAVVVFAIHKDVIATLAADIAAAGHSVCVLNGATPERDRQPAIDAFQAGKLRALVIQVESGGEGLTLTKASRGFAVECPWTPAKLDQAIARIHRRGQTCDVRFTLLSLNQSIDDVVLRTIERKRALIAEIV